MVGWLQAQVRVRGEVGGEGGIGSEGGVQAGRV